MAPGVIGFVIQPIFITDVDWLAVDKGRAAIVGNVIAVVGIADQKTCLLAIPLQRGCQQCVLFTAKVAPVILILLFGDQAEGETVAQRTGDIQRACTATFTGVTSADAGVPAVLRLLLTTLIMPPGF